MENAVNITPYNGIHILWPAFVSVAKFNTTDPSWPATLFLFSTMFSTQWCPFSTKANSWTFARNMMQVFRFILFVYINLPKLFTGGVVGVFRVQRNHNQLADVSSVPYGGDQGVADRSVAHSGLHAHHQHSGGTKVETRGQQRHRFPNTLRWQRDGIL